jgi:cellulose synthase operon protein C
VNCRLQKGVTPGTRTLTAGFGRRSLGPLVALVALAAPAMCASALAAETPEHCALVRKHGHRAEARMCFETLVRQGERQPAAAGAYLRAEGFWGLGAYEDANREFRAAVAQADASALYRVRWGMLLHERFNDADAEGLFKEALMRDPNDAGAYLGLALVSADGFDDHAVERARKALALDPHLVAAHELLASIALEDSETEQAAREADAALSLANDALDAMAVHASIELLEDREPASWLDRIRAINPTYGEGYAIVAHHLVLHLRYREAIDYYRKAVAADPELWSARSQLGITLMRLGQDEEARAELVQCYAAGYRNEETVNSLRLLDSEAQNFVTFKDSTTILRLAKKEADLLYPYVLPELKRDIADYERKYHFKLPAPVQVELYPDHEDFAVRTLGMPGLGALGVTFGEEVAMDSPSGRKPGDFHWAATLRHEMSHVFILTETDHRVPRWFTEGLAVHEETQASPEWGDPMTPAIILALRAKKLLPVADLDRGFVMPQYPAQVQVSYFEAGRICDFIQERWGVEKLNDIVHSYALRKSTREALEQNLGLAPEAFDKQFQAWLYASVGSTLAGFDEWHQRLAHLAQLSQEKQYGEVAREGEAVIRLYPDYVYEQNAYELTAQADVAEQNAQAAVVVLRQYQARGGRQPETLKELARLEEDQGHLQEAAATLDRINYIDPAYDEELHRHLGGLWMEAKNYTGAIREYRAVLALNPLDKASAEFNLAQAYFAAGAHQQAEDAVLASLEVAPGYRPAQKLLLQIEGK